MHILLLSSAPAASIHMLWVVAWLLGMLAGLWLAKPGGKREPSH